MNPEYESECVCLHECRGIVNAKCMNKPKNKSLNVVEFIVKDEFFGDSPAIAIKCEDLFYPNYPGKYFILKKSNGYGFFNVDGIIQTFTKGEILDKYGITL